MTTYKMVKLIPCHNIFGEEPKISYAKEAFYIYLNSNNL